MGRTPDFDKWTRPWVSCARHGRVQAIQGWKYTKASSPERPWGKHGATAQYEWRCPDHRCATTALLPIARRPGSEAVDWSRPGRLVGDRYSRHARNAKTWEKIQDGHRVYEGAPFIVEMRGGGSTHRPLSSPLSTITAGGNHHLLVHGAASDVRDRYTRLLDVHERKVAMAFPKGYQLVTTAEKKKDQQDQRVSLVGMAVTPNVSRDIGCMVSEFITGEPIEPVAPVAA